MLIAELFCEIQFLINWIKVNHDQASALAAVVSAITSFVALIGLYFVWVQLNETKKIAQQQFEDSLAKEFRELINKIPTNVMLGESLSDEEFEKHFDEFFHYFDLTNEQIILKKRNRISDEVWSDWNEGIEAIMNLPVFQKAWARIENSKINQFNELRKLIKSNKKINQL